MKNCYQISDIIVKNILGTLSDNEKLQLQEWMEKSPKNKQQYKEWMKQLSREIHTDEPIDVQQAWKNVQKRIPQKKNTPVHSLPYYIVS